MFMLAPCRIQTGDAALVEAAPSSNRQLNQITRRALASGEGTPTQLNNGTEAKRARLGGGTRIT
jgi:hypothetical protein